MMLSFISQFHVRDSVSGVIFTMKMELSYVGDVYKVNLHCMSLKTCLSVLFELLGLI